MLEYPEKVKAFLQANFEPSCDNLANFKKTTQDLLRFLFQVFPRDCVSDYELDDILNELGYKKHMWAEESTTNHFDDDDQEFFKITKQLVTGWCLKTDIDLRDQEIKAPRL